MYTRILVPLDNSTLAEHAIPTAELLARSAGASLDLVYVHEPEMTAGYPDAPWNAARRSSEESYIHTIADEVRSSSGVPTTGVVVVGHAAAAICEHARASRADLIVSTTHGRTGISRAWIGSVADAVARHAPVPTLLLRPAPGADPNRVHIPPPVVRHVLVPIDGLSMSQAALAGPAEFARSAKARMIVVSVVEPVPMIMPDLTLPYTAPSAIPDMEATEALVQEAKLRLAPIARHLTDSGVRQVEWHVVVDPSIAHATLEGVREYGADIVAVPISDRGPTRLAAGTLADHIMRGCRSPVLLYRAQGAVKEAGPVANTTESCTV
ncbi:MAG TPA: universal stress protein [Gemmatimonadaceae bacterium]|nr:universal stress protein [Gemmatimonadaceae bacterium]